MIRQFPVAFGVMLGLSASALWGSDHQQVRLRWADLAPRIEGRNVALALPDGTFIKGKVEAVVPEGLWLRVKGTSDRRVMPKGSQLIPRESVPVLRVTEHRAIARPVCALAAAGLIASQVATMDDNGEGPAVILRPVGAVAGGLLGALGGYYAGKVLDRKVTEILVIREDRSGSER